MELDEYDRVFRHETSHFWYRGLHALVLGAIARYLVPPAGRAVEILDAGCGTGGLALHLAERGRVTGVDVSRRALSWSRTRGHRRLVQASIERLPLRAASFDLVVSTDVLYHRAVRDDVAALAELARVCRPGGILLLNLPAHEWLRGSHDRVIHTARRYARREVLRLARQARLEVVRIARFNALLFPLAATLRLARRGGPDRSDVTRLAHAPNALLSGLLRFEAWLTLRAPLPVGLSLFAVLRKPVGP